MGSASPYAPQLSIVVPAFNEAGHVREHLRRITAVVESLGRPFEVILVDDGSRDATAAEADAAARDDARIAVVRHGANEGKGAALATGCRAARGDVLVFLDADLEIAPESIGPLLARMDADGAGVAVGSKYVEGSRERRPLWRAMLSRLYLAVTSVLFRLPIRDTQTGLKALRRDVADAVVPALRTRRWAWDVELLVLAHRVGARIVAVPVTVDFRRPGVRIGWRGFLDSGLDTLAVFLRDRGLAAYGRVAKTARRAGRRRDSRAGPRVVVSGDDLGLSHSIDRGLLAAARDGRLSSVSFLVDGPTSESAAAALCAMRSPPDVGVHIDFAQGRLFRFLARSIAGLVSRRELRDVVRSAVASARSRGLSPSHVDAHRHAFFLPSTYLVVAHEARRLGIRSIRWPRPAGSLRCGAGLAGLVKGAVLSAAAFASRGSARAAGLACPDGIVDAAVATRWVRSGCWPRSLSRSVVEIVAHPIEGIEGHGDALDDELPVAERGLDRAADARALVELRDGFARLGVRALDFSTLGAARRPRIG
jgi:dolichol-phosphate mannosyltransferase